MWNRESYSYRLVQGRALVIAGTSPVGAMWRLASLLSLAAGCSDCEDTSLVQLKPKREEIIGYWAWAWTIYLYGPDNATIGICFNGQETATEALNYCETMMENICGGATGTCAKWLSISGGGLTIDSSILSGTSSAAESIKAAGYSGVILDVENIEQDAGDMVTLFADTTAALKTAGLTVGITTSHSCPLYCSGCTSADIVEGWVKDKNIDILSPQLYGSDGSTLDLDPLADCPWSLWENSEAQFVPSIPYASDYDEAQDYFSNFSITFGGYFQWMQTYNGVTTYWCGANFTDAAENCYKMCPSMEATDCDAGQYCYQPVTTCSGSDDPGPGTTRKPMKRHYRRHHRRHRHRPYDRPYSE